MQSNGPGLSDWHRERRLWRLVARYLILTLAVIAAILIAFYELRVLEISDDRAGNLRLEANRLLEAQINEETAIRGYAVTGDRRFLGPYFDGKAQLEGSANRMATERRARGAEAATVTHFTALHNQWENNVAQPVLRDPVAGRDVGLEMNGKELVDSMRADLAALDAMAAQDAQENTRLTHLVQYLEALAIIAVIAIIGVLALVYERRSVDVQARAFAEITESSHTATRIGEWRMKVIAMLAHDFKSALAVISACADVLQEFPEKRDDPGPYRGIHESVEQLSEMTDEALLMARIASDALKIKHERVELAPVLHSVAARYHQLHPIRVQAKDEAVEGDEAYLLRAFDNVISNATKYSAPFQPVDIEVKRDGSEIEVLVRDRGQGIDPEDLPHIFEEYWRSPHATGAVGAGVGLFIVRKIIDAHNGSIDVISLPGIGTTLYVRLPAISDPPK
ncbi:MAG: CHASE3 domain-containing protein [Candidatus Eremiobacteraeota bacterium]|nr:CHASE3 domain-containing protein [Candidatus Eremiobacteraeota bacterium]